MGLVILIRNLAPSVWVVGVAVFAVVWLLMPAGFKLIPYAATSQRFHLNFGVLAVSKGKQTGAADLVFAEVAALLRAGVPPGAAWRRAAGVEVDSFGVPDRIALSLAVGPEAAVAMTAASQLAARLGAPLAQVLQSVAEALRAEAQTQGDREAALAGPQTTSRVLMALPMLGFLLGVVLGANPLQVMLSGGIGTLTFLVGALLLLAGRWWISRLVAAAANNSGVA